jgi:hypothetical protein
VVNRGGRDAQKARLVSAAVLDMLGLSDPDYRAYLPSLVLHVRKLMHASEQNPHDFITSRSSLHPRPSFPLVFMLQFSARDARRVSSTTAPQTPPASRTITLIFASTTPGRTLRPSASSPGSARRQA